MFKKALLSSAIILASHCTFANTLILKADAALDVHTGKLITPATIVVKDKTIVSVSQHTPKEQINKNTEVITLHGHTLLPGLFDMHVHLTGDSKVHGYERLRRTVPRSAITGAINAKRTLEAGFTSVRNLGASGFADLAIRDAIYDGDIPGPRVFASGPAIGITGGHCDTNAFTHEHRVTSEGVADGPWAVRHKVRENVKYGVDVIKFCATGGVMSQGTKVGAQQYSFEEMRALVDEVHMRGLTVAAHAHGTNGIKSSIRAGVDSVEHVSFLDDEAIQLALKHGTYFSMDIYTTEYILGEGAKAGIPEESLEKERQVGSIQRDSFTKAVKAGVKMVFGSDGGIYPHGDNAKQFSRMVQFGMTELQALQAATINSATLLNLQGRLGSLEQGKFADIIAVPGNPLDNIKVMESVTLVVKNGKVEMDQRLSE
ncbi:metal-dependent hydrolase family protein [Pseudoalteromonas luteoviolacea]|uniref:Xaa-Pro dipeptidase n=1 Tax=Pseudoalteromonas luteoviolacea S4054 TaxID=1129367 RepID=A0A0F6AHT0_9GAMM|nr:amidohydrolase family protein [Pseudoalteromonas luteoviolacea]AOT07965.1 Xaa-Pro dipeptidase [Pseudoalteromonas luteoviolacea]AOT12881.1 Xaa-Pro dipeptidase [Pseudoalteromonas luteoviolacea]AOT17794.1 Xaa-Pro dipeptidase [Pseudoalteromonas luteoviolacea]KKE85790.1 Xaa-Pro dipeptidase [Pseudoalteromonas luteoviolacea S4054]KZN74668.1 Xaa-Pro dipeptidase [Pseudoalteromonas luteoviolacea S4047-1]